MIAARGLSVDLGGFALRDITLEVTEGEYFVILGPTGAGKSVFIETLAGLHKPVSGEIWMDGRDVTTLPPEQRGIGYVPQDYALFPFLDVKENITFGLRRGRRGRAGADAEAERIAHLLGISHLLPRAVGTLSGGEKQRVALARALAPVPRALLLDEPMGSVDVRTSKYLRLELKRLHDELGVTTIHVTHNLLEARELADRLAIMNAGRIEQCGTPDEIFFYPRNHVVSDFIGTPNILDVDSCRDLGHGLIEAASGSMSIILPHEGAEVRKIALFPRDVYVSPTKPPGPELNRFKGVVTEMHALSSLMNLKVRVGEKTLVAELPKDVCEEMGIEVGREVFLILKLRSLRVY